MERWIDIAGTTIPIDTVAEREAAFAALRAAGLRAGLVRTPEKPDGGSATEQAEYLWLPEFL